ncbi:VWA domain-containing protein [Chloracidobacterium validum]|uniref:VWA domain-containing protein n=1 Tax=Chloracidobacterium validum TaxID=2821543 RepID=A0ABX8BD89_9BACT|nr:VIT domain-containing protein [Chloracidobacterium validum]QUW03613.1 VWA domain-containing protein [Chloracidobacterium validum]
MNDAADQKTNRQLGTLAVEQSSKRVALPLERVCISARVVERIAEVEVRQTFANDFDQPLEAVYIFPLAGGAAITQFEVTFAGRTLTGALAERKEARQQYAEAVQQGYRAALLESERDDVFTIQVGNLPPRETAEVRLVYVESLPFWADGMTELRLPTVVAPRYIAGQPLDRDSVGTGVESDTDRVPDASRITPPRLAPGFDPNVGLKITVEFDGEDLADLSCVQHAISLTLTKGKARISLAQQTERLNRDFVLRWKSAGDDIQLRARAFPAKARKVFTMLTLTPPVLPGREVVARDVTLVLDRSGSMGAVKMLSAVRAVTLLLRSLTPQDRFAILAFDDRMEWFDQGQLRSADGPNLTRGEQWLRTIESRGGTEVTKALTAALDGIQRQCTEANRLPVIILLTDGQVGDESSALKLVQERLGHGRLFTVGIDTAVNDAFLNRLAKLGRGTATMVTPDESLDRALRQIAEEMGTPVLRNLAVVEAASGASISTLAPMSLPDLFPGRPVTVFLETSDVRELRVTGVLPNGKAWQKSLKPVKTDVPALAHLWARHRIADLDDQFRLERASHLKQTIIDLSISHSVLSRFTAFLVVDKKEIVNQGGKRLTYVQPVETPARWETETNFTLGAGFCPFPPFEVSSPRDSAAPPPAAPPPAAPLACAMLHFTAEVVASATEDSARNLTQGAPDATASLPDDLTTVLADFAKELTKFVQLADPSLPEKDIETLWAKLASTELDDLAEACIYAEVYLSGHFSDFKVHFPETQRLLNELDQLLWVDSDLRFGGKRQLSAAEACAQGFCAKTFKPLMEACLKEIAPYVKPAPPMRTSSSQEDGDFWSGSI